MPACYGAPYYVEAPAVTPLRYGLFSVAELTEAGAGKWEQGVEYEPAPCGPASVYACPTCEQNDGNTAPSKTYEQGVQVVQSFPFTVYGSFACSPIGNWDRGFERAREALLSGEERAVENEIALGNNHSSISLTSATAVDITPTPGTAVEVHEGIALLEQYGAFNGNGQHVLMMSRRDAILAVSNGSKLIYPDGSTLRTMLGTPVAALSGFNGRTGPNDDAAAAGDAWIFATGRPVIRRSGVFMTPADRQQALNQRNNNFEILAERTYEVSWPCITAGILVNSIGS